MEVKRFATLGLVAALLFANVASAQSAPPPTPQEVEEAKRRYQRGVELYNEGADQAALVELERAYKLAPHYKILYSIGLVYQQLNNFTAALKAFEQYLSEGGREIPPPRRTEVDQKIEVLKGRVASIELSSNVPDADIAIDDVVVAKTPLSKPLQVNPGYHKIRVSKIGFLTETKVVSVAGGDKLPLVIDLKSESGPSPPPTPVAPPPAPTSTSTTPVKIDLPPPPPKTTAMWVSWTATGALALGAGVTGFLALRANNDLSKAKTDTPTGPDELARMGDKAKTFALVADILTGAAVIAGGIAIYLTVKSSPARQVGLAISPTSLGLRGSF